LGCDRAAGARPVFDDELLSKDFAEALTDQAGDDVAVSPRRERDHDAHRLLAPPLRLPARRHAQFHPPEQEKAQRSLSSHASGSPRRACKRQLKSIQLFDTNRARSLYESPRFFLCPAKSAGKTSSAAG